MSEWLKERWNIVSRRQIAEFFAGLAVFLVLLAKSEPGFVHLLDDANLLFHEAGHPFYGLFSDRLCVYGGTMGQLTFPVVLAITFWRRREPLSVAASVIWFFENGLNIARYMADARTQVLPLVGGGDHDWATILGRWHLMAYDTRMASWLRGISWIGMILPVMWVAWLYMSTSPERVASSQTADEMEAKFKTFIDRNSGATLEK